MTPYYANFGYHPGNNYPAVEVISKVPAAEELVLTLKKLREDMRESLLLAQKRMAKYYNRKVAENELKFKVGDWVMVNAKDFKTIRPSKKLDHKMRGKFQIKRLVGLHAYELGLPVSSDTKHPVFHVSMLEPYYPNDIVGRRTPTPPPVDLDEGLFELEEVLSSRVRYRKVQYLAKWKGQGPDENSWEPYDSFLPSEGAQECIKEFHRKNEGMPKDPRVMY